MDEYAMFGSAASVLGWVSLACVFIGSFLQHDGYPGHTLVGGVGSAAGWVVYVLNSTVAQHEFAERQLDCSLYGRNCVATEENVLVALLDVLLEPVKTALSPGTLLPPIAAFLLGLAAAKLTNRAPKRPVDADD